MRILLLGKNGQLGWELNRSLMTLGEVIALDYPEIDLTDLESIDQTVYKIRPQVIVNATAYTAVDRAETEPEIAMVINGEAPGVLAKAARTSNAILIHYSTDYVFDGSKGIAYVESDKTNPLNVYGKSKLEGEQAITSVGGAYLILRTSWVYSLRGNSFVNKVMDWSRAQNTLRIVSDQIGCPTWARMLGEASAQILACEKQDVLGWIEERKGIYHLAGEGCASRLQWAQSILSLDPHPEKQITKELIPTLTDEFPTLAQRPLNSTLNCELFFVTFGLRLPPWKEALRLALTENP